jgi:undecaprenyl phosphate N,N'-diacetylbacillosamine 1-phosphate transferase
MYKHFLKRLLDFLLALIGLILISPLFLVLWVWLTVTNKRAGAFFIQERPGKDEKIFKLYKFKSMTDQKNANGNLLPDAERLTRVGKFIRKTSLDELPQLWNVLKGDMSLIGPRPLRTYYLPLYNETQKRRHEVRPGITGWAQVNGRNAISWKEKFDHDVYYVDNISFRFDLRVLFLTIKKVFYRDGIAKQGFETTEPFNGSN